jgi:hypothetical protein
VQAARLSRLRWIWQRHTADAGHGVASIASISVMTTFIEVAGRGSLAAALIVHRSSSRYCSSSCCSPSNEDRLAQVGEIAAGDAAQEPDGQVGREIGH